MFEHFVVAQDRVYQQVIAELASGRKTTHWMWFIFPQIAGLGLSPMSQHYAIHSLVEAGDYLNHPVLGPRLRECAALVNAATTDSIGDILLYPDDLKFRSSMTLFAHATEDNAVFRDALTRYFAGEQDQATLDCLGVPD